MRKLSRTVVFALGLVMSGGTAAHALNFCFNPGIDPLSDPDHASLAVAEKFKKPSRGNCSPIHGFDIAEGPGRLVTGTACLNSSGDALQVSYTIHPQVTTSGPVVFLIDDPHEVTMLLPYPSLADGPGAVVSPAAVISKVGSLASSHNAHANPCIPPVIPIP